MGVAEDVMGVQIIVTRSGETFVHPGNTISEVALLPREKGTRGIPAQQRAFR